MANSYKGAITFGLVYIPISFSPSIKDNDFSFNMIDKKTMSRIKYKKTCVNCDEKEVKPENIVKGYQYEKDKFVLFSDEDFEKIKTPKDKNITIQEFVDLDEIDPIFFDKAYYVQPNGGDKAFTVLLQAMEKENKVALAKTVLGTKESLIMIRAKNNQMLVNTMYFFEEIQDAPEVKKIKVDKKEMDLAISLINKMTNKFNPQKYKDEYNEKIKKAIKSKIKGNKIVAPKSQSAPCKVVNLMEALKKSLSTKKSTGKAKNGSKKLQK